MLLSIVMGVNDMDILNHPLELLGQVIYNAETKAAALVVNLFTNGGGIHLETVLLGHELIANETVMEFMDNTFGVEQVDHLQHFHGGVHNMKGILVGNDHREKNFFGVKNHTTDYLRRDFTVSEEMSKLRKIIKDGSDNDFILFHGSNNVSMDDLRHTPVVVLDMDYLEMLTFRSEDFTSAKHFIVRTDTKQVTH